MAARHRELLGERRAGNGRLFGRVNARSKAVRASAAADNQTRSAVNRNAWSNARGVSTLGRGFKGMLRASIQALHTVIATGASGSVVRRARQGMWSKQRSAGRPTLMR